MYFDDIVSTWNLVQDKQEAYLLTLNDEMYDKELSWIDDAENRFHELRSKKCQLDIFLKEDKIEKEKAEISKKTQEIAEEQELKRQEEIKDTVKKLKENYKVEVNRLNNICQSLEKLPKVTERVFKNVKYDFDNQYNEVKKIIDALSQLENQDKSFELEQAELTEISTKFFDVMYAASNSVVSQPENGGGDVSEDKKFATHMEKMKFPKFSGNCRDWPQFRKDFEKQVENVMKDEATVSYALRNALRDHIKSLVRNMSDDLKEMWRRLEERYGDEGKIVEIVLNDIKHFKPLRENEERRLLQFIDIIEKANLELKYLNRESEIKNSTIISIIEEKLPDELRRKWIERIYDKDSTIDKKDKFPGFLKFLLERKMVIEYEITLTKRNRDEFKGNVKMTISKNEETDISKIRCLLHPSGAHRTEECRLFLDKNVRERADIVKENRACFNCLNVGHTSRTCRNRNLCSKAECGKNHHVLLHDDNFLNNRSEKTGFSAKCDVSNQPEKSLLQIMPIEVNSVSDKQEVLALWDSGSTVSLILNSLAHKLKLRGKPVSITMETLGNVVKKQTNLFVLQIKDQKNNLVQLEAYGVDEISRDIYSTEPQKKIFPEEFNLIENKKAQIGLLLGLNVVQHHPAPVKRKENFVLFENAFGKCVSGSSCHSSRTTFTKVNFVQTEFTVEDFYKVENLGISCNPKCGNCQCGNCPLGSSEFSIKEKKELDLIDKGLTLCDKVWTAQYPWIKDPKNLPNNV